jgi:hypothetical protein
VFYFQARGKAGRKRVSEMKVEHLQLTAEEEEGIVKIQARARGNADRKKVAEMRNRPTSAPIAELPANLDKEEVVK